MLFYLFVIFILLVNIDCNAQNTFHLKVNMEKTIECGLFSPIENDNVIIRGTFNGWKGNDYVLYDFNNDNIYEQNFIIDSDTGITHEFKYLILKSNGEEFWEKIPNKNNRSNGNRFLDSKQNGIDEFDFDKYYLGVIGKEVIFSIEELREDFVQFRKTLEEQHCCLYEYTSKEDFDSLFESQFKLLNKSLSPIGFYKILTPITAKIGCGHTAVWMPGGFWDIGKNKLFPLKFRFIEDKVIITACYLDTCIIPKGTILHEINGVPIMDIILEMRSNYSADAINIHFINSQIERRFPLIYARRFGFKDSFTIKVTYPGEMTTKYLILPPTSVSIVRKYVFKNFKHPLLQMEILNKNTAVLIIPTFIYYDRVTYFTNYIDSCFAVIRNKNIKNLILDLRGNDGGDPFCAAPLFSYLQEKPEPYFLKPYGKYSELANPIPLPKNHFKGNLFTIIDGRCFSTNGHFCSLLKYHKIGKFVGTESGATYKCNAGKNTHIRLNHTKIQLYFGRSTFAAAVEGMDKTKPISPDYPVIETLSDFLGGKDTTMDFILNLIDTNYN